MMSTSSGKRVNRRMARSHKYERNNTPRPFRGSNRFKNFVYGWNKPGRTPKGNPQKAIDKHIMRAKKRMYQWEATEQGKVVAPIMRGIPSVQCQRVKWKQNRKKLRGKRVKEMIRILRD